MPRGEVHVQLSVDYADDPKLRALARYGREGRLARDLYVQMLCYCKRNLTDGEVPDEQLGLLVYPEPVKVGRRDAERLVEIGVLERDAGGYLVKAYLKRNKSRAQVRQESEEKHDEAVRGNHERWHVRRGVVSPDCPYCDPDPNRGSDRVPDRGGESTETETETETIPIDRGADRGAALDERFDEFWAAYPKRKAKGAALKAWRAALRRKVDPEHIIGAAKAYADVVADKDQTYVKHPATWLNAECYDDEVHQPSPPRLSNADAWMAEQ